MTVLSDKWIKEMVRTQNMISPFEDKQVRGIKISYGLSSFGYDARVSNEFKIFTNVNSEIIDPKILNKITLFLKMEKNVLFLLILLFYQAQSNILKYQIM